MQLERAHTPGRLTRVWINSQRQCLLQLGALTRRLRPPSAHSTHLEVGRRGEFEALFFLRQQGFQIVERRWRSPEHNGDLDLIAWELDTLCFIEVKARTERDLSPAASAVDSRKRRMLSQMAVAYIRILPRARRRELVLRFDVVSVYLLPSGVECELLRNAFPRQDAAMRSPGAS